MSAGAGDDRYADSASYGTRTGFGSRGGALSMTSLSIYATQALFLVVGPFSACQQYTVAIMRHKGHQGHWCPQKGGLRGL